MKKNEEHPGINDTLFYEDRAAAQSLKNAWTRMASSYGSMMIVLSQRMLTIKPHGITKWLFLLLGLDLYHEISIANIRAVTEKGKRHGYGKVELHFLSSRGEERRIWLYLKKHREFIDTTTKVINR